MKTVKIIIPIYGSPAINTLIQLNKDIKIRQINQTEEDLLSKSINWTSIGRATCPYWYVVEIDYKYNPQDPSEPNPMYLIKHQNIESALRLYYQNDIGFAVSIIDGKVEILNFTSSSTAAKPFDNTTDFLTYWGKFKKAYKRRPLAFDLFSRAQTKGASNDKTIIYCTVLESIFVPKNERRKSEFIKQGVTVLRFTNTEIQMVADLYKYRNSIVHGDRDEQLKLIGGSKFTFGWFENCTTLMRKILFKYIDNPW